MNEKKTKVPQRGLGVAQLERIRLEEQNKKDSIFHSSRIDFRPNKSVPFLENSPKLLSDEYILDGVNQKVDHHGVVFGKNLNLPSVMQQRCQQYQQSCSSSSMFMVQGEPWSNWPVKLLSCDQEVTGSSLRNSLLQKCKVNISSGLSSSSLSVQNFQMQPPSNQSYYRGERLPRWPEEVKVKCLSNSMLLGLSKNVSRSHASASSSDDCSVNVEEGNARKREVFAKSRALSESGPSISARETKALDGDFLRLAPPAVALPHLEAVNPRSLTLQLLDCVPSRVAAAAHTPPSGLGISVQQPILGFSPSAEVQIGREEDRGSDFHTEVGADVDLELKL
ncbi:hypothetical protein CQW23_23215 [Capsicum baccatum]|uniref:Uncharacterized protein n=1 Tax=Capsicum baccatum TaxID=33114 RepID=A0A2G2VRB5_CAPBA|nr:hypothetical protein CQW23_23215 [Capsicum baccatum]